jgi:hypothetical protein
MALSTSAAVFNIPTPAPDHVRNLESLDGLRFHTTARSRSLEIRASFQVVLRACRQRFGRRRKQALKGFRKSGHRIAHKIDAFAQSAMGNPDNFRRAGRGKAREWIAQIGRTIETRGSDLLAAGLPFGGAGLHVRVAFAFNLDLPDLDGAVGLLLLLLPCSEVVRFPCRRRCRVNRREHAGQARCAWPQTPRFENATPVPRV